MNLPGRAATGHRWRRRRRGIRMRLLAANSLVVVVGMATTSVVAAIVGPPMFRRLMHRPNVPDPYRNDPYEHAFRDATALSVGIALVASAMVALMLSWYLSRRMHRSATELSKAATAVANGQYDIRVSPLGLGSELDAIAEAFNKMAQRLGAVDETRRQLLADLAHEIRTPVSVLEAYMEALEDGVEQLDPGTIGMLRDQTRRLVRFSVDVNALAMAERRTTSVDARWVSAQTLIETAVAALNTRYLAKGVALKSHVAPDLPALWADPERLGQVLGNLLDNALGHTRAGGQVDISVAAAGDQVTIAVADNGTGVAAEHLPHLFERFYRADAARDRNHGGAGIGLSIAKALVDAHGGQIVAHSDGLGAGSTFTVTLPCLPESRAHGMARGQVAMHPGELISTEAGEAVQRCRVGGE